MSAINRFTIPFNQVLDNNGNPIVGAELFFYEVGTTTKKTIYQNSDLSTVSANPIISTAGGYFPDVFLTRDNYKIVLKDADGNEIFTREPVRYPYPTGITDISTQSVIEIRDDRIVGRVGAQWQFVSQTTIPAALAEHAGQYVPLSVIYGDITNAAYPAYEFWHKSASNVFTKCAIAGGEGELKFYTSDVFAGSNAPRALIISMDRNGNILPEKGAGTQNVGSSTKRLDRVYATNAYNTVSDESVKENFTPIDGQEAWEFLAKMQELKGFTWYYFKTGDNLKHCGISAQDCIIAANHVGWNTAELSFIELGVDGKYGVSYAELQIIINAALFWKTEQQNIKILQLETTLENLGN
jgi:hypothetical protein